MQLIRIIFIAFFLGLLADLTYAQKTRTFEGKEDESSEDTEKKDVHSPDSVFVSYFSLNDQASYHRRAVSKPLNQFQEYDITKINNQFYATLGNQGTAAYPLQYSLNPSADFRFRTDAFQPYKLNDDSIKFFISESPFSHLRYHLGAAKEQKLDLVFSQRIGSGIYLGLNARFANAPGIYLRQRAYDAGGTFYLAFLYPTQRYGALITFRTDKTMNYENGGISDISQFTSNLESNRKVIQVNLADAESRSKGTGLVVQQYFNILNPTISKKIDSTTVRVPRKFDAGRFVYTFRYTRTGNAFQDDSPNQSYYPSYFDTDTDIFDTVLVSHIENCFVYSNEVPDTLGKSFPLQYSFGIRLQNDKIRRDTTDLNLYSQTVPFGMLKGIIKQKTFFKASAFLVLSGYKAGDYNMDGSFYQFFGKKNHKIYLNVSKGLTMPDYFYTSYITDNYSWEKDFNPQDYLKGEVGIMLSGFDLNASYTRLTNYAYLNNQVIPEQFAGAMTILAAHASKEFRIKHWITTIYGATQYISPDDLLQLPAIIGKLTVCYDRVLFKNALHAQIGLSATYHSEWYQDAYMPALKAFYRQNTYISGNYPYLDAFINLNIKRARLFIKYEHFNSAFMGYNYIMVPDYPMADAALKFGISWLFFD